MPYRFDRQRFQSHAQQTMPALVGQGVIWRRYISASGEVPEAYLPGNIYTAETMITAFIGVFPNSIPRMLQNQTPAGMIAAGETFITCGYKLNVNDEIIHRGATYRVDGEPQFVVMDSAWCAILKRGNP